MTVAPAQKRRADAFDLPREATSRIASLGVVALALVLSACSTAPERRSGEPAARGNASPGVASSPPIPPRKGGGYYLDDGPGENPPVDLDLLPDAVPRIEKFASGANRPYDVFGVTYVPDLSGAPYRQRGVGSWYGRKFHGQRTSSGEIYDMYAMTAAHPTLPIPCYALVTNVQNGKSVIVRVNDRGPFLHNRIMDLSYAAALKLGYLSSGSGLIEVEMLQPADIAAGRIPVTSNSLYVASVAAGGTRNERAAITAAEPRSARASTAPNDAGGTSTPSSSLATNANTAALPTAAPVSTGAIIASPVTMPGDEAPLAARYADRGIPDDLIPDTQAPATLPETATSTGFYLQLGAFRARAGADSFAAHVAREIDPAIASMVHVSDANGLYRVRVGPYARRVEADVAATNLRGAIAQPVMVMPEGGVR